jgi:hypothetical protein
MTQRKYSAEFKRLSAPISFNFNSITASVVVVEAPPPAAAALALLSWSTISVASRVVHTATSPAKEPDAPCSRVFFTGGNHAVYRGYRCYRWGTVTVPSGSNRSQNSNLNLNSKNEKINKNHQKIVHDL